MFLKVILNTNKNQYKVNYDTFFQGGSNQKRVFVVEKVHFLKYLILENNTKWSLIRLFIIYLMICSWEKTNFLYVILCFSYFILIISEKIVKMAHK